MAVLATHTVTNHASGSNGTFDGNFVTLRGFSKWMIGGGHITSAVTVNSPNTFTDMGSISGAVPSAFTQAQVGQLLYAYTSTTNYVPMALFYLGDGSVFVPNGGNLNTFASDYIKGVNVNSGFYGFNTNDDYVVHTNSSPAAGKKLLGWHWEWPSDFPRIFPWTSANSSGTSVTAEDTYLTLDETPTSFSFSDITGVDPGTYQTSSVQITGIKTPVTVSISGAGSYGTFAVTNSATPPSLNSALYTALDKDIMNSMYVHAKNAAIFEGEVKSTTITVGTVSDTWTITANASTDITATTSATYGIQLSNGSGDIVLDTGNRSFNIIASGTFSFYGSNTVTVATNVANASDTTKVGKYTYATSFLGQFQKADIKVAANNSIYLERQSVNTESSLYTGGYLVIRYG